MNNIFNVKAVLFFYISIVLSLSVCTPLPEKSFKASGVYYIDFIKGQFRNFPEMPLPGSDIDKTDIFILREWQDKRTPDDCSRAKTEAMGNYEELMGILSPFGKPMPDDAAVFFKRVHNDLDYSVGAVKIRNKRPRPYQRNLNFEPCIDKLSGFSYPSGHSVNARIFALILSDLDPEKRCLYMARADEAALDRVIGGVHHPSDIEAGKRLADYIYIELNKNPSFVKDRDALKKYILR